jgi:hypothetical protein
MKSAHGAYPVCHDDETVVNCVSGVHTHVWHKDLAIGGWPVGPQSLRVPRPRGSNHIIRTRSSNGVLRPESKTNQYEFAKHFFPGSTIMCMDDRSFRDPICGVVILPPHVYQGQFHSHDGQGRLTIDARSQLTSDGSPHPKFSADFDYYSLPIILAPILQA